MLMSMWNVLALVGCVPEAPAPPPAEETKPECTLGFDTLAGKSFVRQERTPDGKSFEADVFARSRFSKDGEALKMRYTTRSLVKVFDYTCAKGKGEILCLQDKPDLTQWCQTLIANKGTCSPAELADLTGASVQDAMKAQGDLAKKLEKLKPDEIEKMKLAFSQPNNQLRGVMHVKVNKEACQLTVRDTYQTMSGGQLQEVDTYVGNSVFVESEKELLFDECQDQAGLVALEKPDATPKPGETKVTWKVGESVPFKYVDKKLAKAEDGCTYTKDEWVMYEPLNKGVAVAPGEKGELTWAFSHTFDKPGSKVAHMYRYKTCSGGAAELVDVSCVMVKLEP